MALTLDQMASKGKAKYDKKKSTMVSSYKASIARQNTGYDATPFGATRKSAYRNSQSIREAFYTESALDSDKWLRNWKAKMSE